LLRLQSAVLSACSDTASRAWVLPHGRSLPLRFPWIFFFSGMFYESHAKWQWLTCWSGQSTSWSTFFSAHCFTMTPWFPPGDCIP